MITLADFLGIDRFTAAVTAYTDEYTSSRMGRWDSSLQKMRIQGTFLFNFSYQLSGHLLNKVHAGACGARGFVLGKIPQQHPDVVPHALL